MELSDQLILKGFTEGSFLGRSNRSFELELKTAVTFYGKELAKHLLKDERPIICLPIKVSINSKVNSGAFLLLETRVVLAWSEGWRVKKSSFAFDLAEVSRLKDFQINTQNERDERTEISFTAGETEVEVIVDQVLYGAEVAPWLVRALEGKVNLNNYVRPQRM